MLKTFLSKFFYKEWLIKQIFIEHSLYVRPLKYINELKKQKFLPDSCEGPIHYLDCGDAHTSTHIKQLYGTKYTHKWIHIESWNLNKVREVYQHQFSGCDIVQFSGKMLPLKETGWLLYKTSLYHIYQLPVNPQSSENEN